jgi:DNA polymerase-3 subunit gamma/tau
MEPQVIYRRWRPHTLSEVVGQETITTTLRNAVRTGRVGHAYLFSGPRGTGKTSTGRILAKAVNCTNPVDGEPCGACEACLSIGRGETLDIIEIDAASNRGVDDIRMLRERVGYAAASLRRKVYIIDEVHMLTEVASNALLKTLEEPPPHVMFVLATTELHKVLPTIVSRCQCFSFRRLAFGAIVAKLKRVCETEAIEAADETLALIARAAGGSLRDAENLLQQLIASHGVSLSPTDVREELGVVEEANVLRLAQCIVSRDLSGGLRLLHETVDGGVDARHLGRQIVEWLHDMVLIKSGCRELTEVGPEQLDAMQRLVEDVRIEDLARAMKHFSGATTNDGSRQLLSLELALVDWSVLSPAVAPASDREREEARPARAPVRTAPRSTSSRAGARGPTTAAAGAEAARTAKAAGPAGGVAEAVSHGEARKNEGGVVGAATGGGREAAGQPATAAAPAGPTPAAAEGGGPVGERPVSPPVTELVETTELGRVRARWKDYVDSLRGLGSTGNLDAFLRSACEPAALEDDVLVLRFAHEFHRSKIEDPKYCHIVEEQLQRFYGRPYRVSCVLGGQADTAAQPVPLPSGGLVDALKAVGGRVTRQGPPPVREGGDRA